MRYHADRLRSSRGARARRAALLLCLLLCIYRALAEHTSSEAAPKDVWRALGPPTQSQGARRTLADDTTPGQGWKSPDLAQYMCRNTCVTWEPPTGCQGAWAQTYTYCWQAFYAPNLIYNAATVRTMCQALPNNMWTAEVKDRMCGCERDAYFYSYDFPIQPKVVGNNGQCHVDCPKIWMKVTAECRWDFWVLLQFLQPIQLVGSNQPLHKPKPLLLLEWDACGIPYGQVTYNPTIPAPPVLATVRKEQTAAHIRVWRSKWATAYNIRCYGPGKIQVPAKTIVTSYPPGLAQFDITNLARGSPYICYIGARNWLGASKEIEVRFSTWP